MVQISERSKRRRIKTVGNNKHFLNRIKTTLYYGKLPLTDRLSLPLTELAAELFSEAQHGHSLERLHCNDAATISRNACVSPCSLVLALLYLERLKSCNPDYIQKIAPSELFLVSLMVSSKFLHDDGEDDEVQLDEWASSAGITSNELVSLEKEFLNAIDWKVFVNELTFWKKLEQLETNLAQRQGSNRGWYTYTELKNLLIVVETSHLVQLVAKVSMVLIATYTAGLLTLFGSMLVASQIPGSTLVTPERTIAINESTVQTEMSDLCMETDCDLSNASLKNNLDATDVLTTSILLASIKSCTNSTTDCIADDDDSLETQYENSSWQWWNNPLMNWLFDNSNADVEPIDTFEAKYHVNFNKYIDVFVANCKTLELEDQVHKASKVRIQDQLERSWHKEWTDTFQKHLLPINQFYYHTRTTVS